MDVASHGLWGGVLFGRKNRKDFWLAFIFGIAPDMLSFGIFFVQRIFLHGFEFRPGPPALNTIPSYVGSMYNLTHSLIVFGAIFLIVLALRKKILWPMFAWGFHVVLDIFTHSEQFFPTPFLWPVFDYTFDGISWGHPAIWYTNLGLLIVFYGLFWRKKSLLGGVKNQKD